MKQFDEVAVYYKRSNIRVRTKPFTSSIGPTVVKLKTDGYESYFNDDDNVWIVAEIHQDVIQFEKRVRNMRANMFVPRNDDDWSFDVVYEADRIAVALRI